MGYPKAAKLARISWDGVQNMKRPLVVAMLTVALLLMGCASEQTSLPPGIDPDRLVETFVRNGQDPEPAPVKPRPPAIPSLDSCVHVLALAGAACVVLPACLLYEVAKARTANANFPAWP
jgi:hypothetical protein